MQTDTQPRRAPARMPGASQASNPYRRNGDQAHSYTSSSDADSYEADHSLSRGSESGTSQTHYDDAMNEGHVLADSYAQEEVDWNGGQPVTRTSILDHTFMDRPDQTTLHLMIQTATQDSQGFSVLPIPELERVKREEASASQQISVLRRRLHMELKVRNAAHNVSQLSLNDAGKGQPNGIVTDDEHQASIQRCDELAKELWKLERRRSDMHDAHLRHTAAVLLLNYQDYTGGAHDYMNGTHDFDDFEIGTLADTEDGIMDLPQPGSDLKTEASLQELLTTLTSHEQTLRKHLQETGHSQRSLQELDLLETPSQTHGSESSLDLLPERVQRICERAMVLSQQQADLQAQLQKEREQGGLSESNVAKERDALRDERDELVREKEDHLQEHEHLNQQYEALNEKYAAGQRNLKDHQSRLAELREYADQSRQELEFHKSQLDEREFAQQALQQQLGEHQTKLQAAEQELQRQQGGHQNTLEAFEQEHQRQLDDHQAKLASVEQDLRQQLDDRQTKLAAAEQELQRQQEDWQTKLQAAEAKTRDSVSADATRKDLESEVARLQTELTATKAELDAAHGARAERDADAANASTVTKELEEFKARNETLHTELKELVGEHEQLVQQGVEAERARENMELEVDRLREQIEVLQTRIHDTRVKSMALTGSPRHSGGAAVEKATDSTALTTMRNEFKKMMREMRADHFRQLRAEQEERRKLETQLRSLSKSGAKSNALGSSLPPSPATTGKPST